MMKLASILLVCMASVALAGNSYHVTTAGTSGSAGTSNAPWSFQYAIDSAQNHGGSLTAGDTVWVHGGTYYNTGTTSSSKFQFKIHGTANAPIIVRNYNNERAILNGSNTPLNQLYVWPECEYVWFWGLEVCNTNIQHRTSATNASEPTDIDLSDGFQGVGGDGCKYINMIFHDITGSGWFEAAHNIEIYGCLAYDIGWTKSDRTSGYPFYVQNQTGRKRIKHNVIVNNYSYGVHGYGSENAYLDSITVEYNLFRPSDLLIGGGQMLSYSDSICWNVMFNPWEPAYSGGIQLGFASKGPSGAVVKYNWLHSQYYMMDLKNAVSCDVSLNTFYTATGSQRGADGTDFDGTYPNNTFNESSNEFTSGDTVIVHKNVYESKRCNIGIVNLTQADSVSVNVSSTFSNGDTVSVKNSMNWFGDAAYTAVVSGGTIKIPMSSSRWTQDTPGGESAPREPTTFPRFGIFIATSSSATQEQAPVSTGKRLWKR